MAALEGRFGSDLCPLGSVRESFLRLCARAGRKGLIAATPVEGVRLLPEQGRRLQMLLDSARIQREVCAVSLGLLYHPAEILAVPPVWQSVAGADDAWNAYAGAYTETNRALNHICDRLAREFGGVAEKATVEGWAGTVSHVDQYFAHCVSHRAFAEAAGLGWRGLHGLIVTPEAGPALRLATLFLPGKVAPHSRKLAGCGECRACLDACPILASHGADTTGPGRHDYREMCRRRITALGLQAEVCGICVRVCREQVIGRPSTEPITGGTATRAQDGT